MAKWPLETIQLELIAEPLTQMKGSWQTQLILFMPGIVSLGTGSNKFFPAFSVVMPVGPHLVGSWYLRIRSSYLWGLGGFVGIP